MTYTFGRLVEHDPRSKQPRFAAAISRPRTVTWDHTARVLDQGQIGMCTGAALTQWLNTRFGGAQNLGLAVALELYSLATQLDNFPGVYPPTDSGSSGLAVCKAGVRKGYLTGYRWTFSFLGFLGALAQSPLIVGTEWREGMLNPDKDGYLDASGDVLGGHEYLIVGCDTQRQDITILNSWGPGWGHLGRARIKWADMVRLLAAQGDVKVPVR